MMRGLWIFAATLVGLQMLVYLALLIWPGATDLRGAMLRFEAWQATGAMVVQIFLLIPILAWLGWKLTGQRQARWLITLTLVLSLALAASGWIELWLIEAALIEPTDAQDRAMQLAALRWGEAGLALAAAISLRLSSISERL
ncbi:hypothetical protein FGG78_17410 [Thioclava sp. BHET1]|nr:hypothetical protein FGG78_17410 [Thioclava sp. BHET1]